MGTRGAYGFCKNGELKVTYNHFDSYPEGLGQDILDFIHGTSIEEMNKMCDDLQLIDEKIPPTEEQIQKCRDAGSIDLGVSNQSVTDWYCLLRNCQGDLAMNCKVGMMSDDKDFLQDSLFCEYAYIINLDDNVLEVYRGFQQTPPKGRFANTPINENGYY